MRISRKVWLREWGRSSKKPGEWDEIIMKQEGEGIGARQKGSQENGVRV